MSTKKNVTGTYYADQLARIKNPKSEYAPTVVFNHESGKTNHLSLNDESATEIVKWLTAHYNVSADNSQLVFEVSYMRPTDKRGSRVKISSQRFKQSVIISYDSSKRDIHVMAKDWLIQRGYNITGHGERERGFFIMSDTFKPLKGN